MQGKEEIDVKKVYDNYETLKAITKKWFRDETLFDEAFNYALEGLSKNDWERVRKYEGKATFKRYLSFVWCNLLEDFRIKKFGRTSAPKWVKALGWVGEELFNLLCGKNYSLEESVNRVIQESKFRLDEAVIETIAMDILSKIPNCGKKKGPAFSIDDKQEGMKNKVDFPDNNPGPGEMTENKDTNLTLKALYRAFFIVSDKNTKASDILDEKKLNELTGAIGESIQIDAEERLILTAFFVDGQNITTIGKGLGYNQNQIHGKFRRLKERIRKKLPELMANYNLPN